MAPSSARQQNHRHPAIQPAARASSATSQCSAIAVHKDAPTYARSALPTVLAWMLSGLTVLIQAPSIDCSTASHQLLAHSDQLTAALASRPGFQHSKRSASTSRNSALRVTTLLAKRSYRHPCPTSTSHDSLRVARNTFYAMLPPFSS